MLVDLLLDPDRVGVAAGEVEGITEEEPLGRRVKRVQAQQRPLDERHPLRRPLDAERDRQRAPDGAEDLVVVRAERDRTILGLGAERRLPSAEVGHPEHDQRLPIVRAEFGGAARGLVEQLPPAGPVVAPAVDGGVQVDPGEQGPGAGEAWIERERPLEVDRAIIVEPVNVGATRAKAQGMKRGRPKIAGDIKPDLVRLDHRLDRAKLRRAWVERRLELRDEGAAEA